MKARRYSYVSRKLFKRVQRRNWISCINSQIIYDMVQIDSQVCSKFKQNKIALNRKMLSEIIINDPLTFDYLVLQSN